MECESIPWLNNGMLLLTNCLQMLQQLKDKVRISLNVNIFSKIY